MNTPKNQNFKNTQYLKTPQSSRKMLHFSEVELSPELIEKKIYLTRWINALVKPKINFSKKKEFTICSESILRTASGPDEANIFSTKENFTLKSDKEFKKIQKTAALLFRDPSIKDPLTKVSNAIDREILSIKSDVNLREDLNIKNQILNILLCYEPVWLQLGLEIVFNEVAPENDSFSIQNWLEALLLPHFKKTSTYKMMSKNTLNNKLFLKRWFSLVLFLDKAKIAGLFPHNPCLFQKDSLIHGSRDVLLKIASLILSGIGDIIRFLKFYGYILNYEDSYIDKFDYKMTNFLEDLRDGIRLVKIVELVIGNDHLSKKLKAPALSEIQKFQNVQIALDALIAIGFQVQGEIHGRDIVNGHPDKTLSLIWQIVHNLQGPKLEKAAIVIQKWWRKQIEILKMKRNNQELTTLRI